MNTYEAVTVPQQGLQDKEVNNKNCGHWGDKLNSKVKEIVRISFQNINGFGSEAESSKKEDIRRFMEDKEIDVMALAEMNVNWKKVGKRHTINKLIQDWFENKRIITSYNQWDKYCDNHQPGGTAILSIDEMALRVMKMGDDKRKIGRWSWQLFRGKDNITMRVISVYFPTAQNKFGPKKVHIQQQKALLRQKVKTTVWDTFWKDLWTQVDEWLEQGDQLVIGGDWNMDVRKEKFLKGFKDRDLIPAITGKHGSKGPATHNRGSLPIDEIFVSSTLQVIAAGYLSYGECGSDHRPLWVDITKTSALGARLPEIPSFQARRLKCRDPRIVDRYNRTLEEFLRRNNVFSRIQKLYSSFQNPLTSDQINELEDIDNLRVEGMIHAESKCRKLKMGSIRWSPQIQESMDMIKYLKLTISRKMGRKVTARLLIQLSKKLKVNRERKSIEELKVLLGEAYETFKRLKKEHKKLRYTFLEDLANAMEKAGKGKKASNLRNLIQVEDQREMYRKLKYITKKTENLGTTFVTVQDGEGNKIDITGKQEMEAAIIDENRSKYHQTETTCPFLRTPLKNVFGEYGEGEASQAVRNGTYTVPDQVDGYTKDFLEACALKSKIAKQN